MQHQQQIDPREVQEILNQADTLRQRVELVQTQLGYVEDILNDKRQAKQSLAALADAKPDDEVLLPVGGGVFIRAKLGENAAVIKGIGADYAAERPLADARKELDEEIETLGKDQGNLQGTLQKLEANLRQVEAMIQQMQNAHR